MRAKKIYENINFERGQEPKEVMKIGSSPEVLRDRVDWDYNYGEFYDAYIYRDIPVQIVYAPGALGGGADFAGISINGISEIIGKKPRWYKKITNAKKEIEGKIDSYLAEINEAYNFERDGNTAKGLRVGKYHPKKYTFKNYEGDDITIEVIDNEFDLNDLHVKLVFKNFDERDDDDGNVVIDSEYAQVYVDGEKQDMSAFFICPAAYEFFVPEKPSIYVNVKYEKNPDQSTWSKTKSAYGLPLVDENDKAKIKQMQHKYGSWYVRSMDYSRTDKNPFVAVAKIILFTF